MQGGSTQESPFLLLTCAPASLQQPVLAVTGRTFLLVFFFRSTPLFSPLRFLLSSSLLSSFHFFFPFLLSSFSSFFLLLTSSFCLLLSVHSCLPSSSHFFLLLTSSFRLPPISLPTFSPIFPLIDI